MLINTDLQYTFNLSLNAYGVNCKSAKVQTAKYTGGGIFQELSCSDHLKRGLREYENVCLSETVFDPCARQVNDSNSVSLPITAVSAVLQCAEFSR